MTAIPEAKKRKKRLVVETDEISFDLTGYVGADLDLPAGEGTVTDAMVNDRRMDLKSHPLIIERPSGEIALRMITDRGNCTLVINRQQLRYIGDIFAEIAGRRLAH